MAALDKAEAQGFQTDAPHLREIIEHWREPYRRHFFRYHRPDEFPLAEFKQVNDGLVTLEEDVKTLFAHERDGREAAPHA